MTPPHPSLHRQTSTPGMDALADLASMQHHQQAARQSASGLRDPQVYQSQRPSVSLQNIPRSLSGGSAKDFAMSDAPPKPRIYTANSLGQADCQTITELAQSLTENSYDYESHFRLVTLLHKGFVDHVHPPESPETVNDPYTYELLPDLRQAYSAMDKIYPVGEQLWVYWIEDEKLLARTTEDRLSIMELCSNATQDEPCSATLWRLYGDYMYFLFTAAFEIDPQERWSEEDKIMGKEIFNWEQMMAVWDRGIAATQGRMNDSNLVWDRCIEIMMQDQMRWPSPEKDRNIRALFESRLVKPHATWDQTFQMFSSFISTYDNAAYEETMVKVNQRAKQAKKQYSLREPFELNILKAVQASDKDAEWYAFTEYLDWERRKQGVFSFHQINALFERATLRFPTDSSLWEDHVEFLIENRDPSVPLLQVLERATRHCPWSGNLWSHRILTLEAEANDFEEIEKIKHNATQTGLLDVGGMEELLKVYVAWCGFLRRRAFDAYATEDDADIAEVGIRSALEHVKKNGEKKYGKEYQGDPQYRLERIHIKFFTQSGNLEAARECWNGLIFQQRDSYDFWYQYYIWEMIMWSNHAVQEKSNAGTQLRTPQEATALLRLALKRVMTMDWPEQIIQMFLNHCEQHESVQELRTAIIEARRASAQVAKRRQQEAANAAAVAQQQQQQQDIPQDGPSIGREEASGSGKRKRDPESDTNGLVTKKSKLNVADSVEDPVVQQDKRASSVMSQPKRDREHTSIIVKGLPSDATEIRIRQFFRDCGKIKSLSMKPEQDSITATVEFETPEDALFAQTRQSKPFDGALIDITIGAGATLFVSNYPPEADEAYIRKLFEDYGEIIDIRFPSLKFNTHRRFCYVQFTTPEEAQAATRLDGKAIGKLHLLAKISNPGAQKAREGAIEEGREVYVANVDWHAKEDEIKELFSKFGDVETVRIPKNMKGQSKGVAFVVFKTKDEASAAATEMNLKEFKSRILSVSVSHNRNAKRHATTIIQSASPEPSTLHDGANGTANPTNNPPNQRERTIALMNIPDTVNDARIRALAEPYGPLKKIILMPEHSGAILEFVNVQDVGKASLALDGHEITPGRHISVGTAEEMKKMGADMKVEKFTAPKKKEAASATSSLMPAGPISRPSQGSGRRGGKGGLGFKRGGGGFGGPRATEGGSGKEASMDGEKKPVKSNADFKAMFLKGKPESSNDDKEKFEVSS